jgi:hypothetical protein
VGLTCHPLHGIQAHVGGTHQILHENVYAVVDMYVPDFGMLIALLIGRIVFWICEFAEGVEAMKLVEDIFR